MTPTIRKSEIFEPARDAKNIHEALKAGVLQLELAVVDILACRTNQQRLHIASIFKQITNKDLVGEMKISLRGKLRDVVIASLTPTPLYLCEIMHWALHRGWDFFPHQDTIMEILCTLSHDGLHDLNNTYIKVYKLPLEFEIKQAIRGQYQRLLVWICLARRCKHLEETQYIEEPWDAFEDANALREAATLRCGADYFTYTKIFASRSFWQLEHVFSEYLTLTEKNIETTIRRRFSGHHQKCLLMLIKLTRDPDGTIAELFHSCIEGKRTNDSKLIRLLLTRSELDLKEVKNAFNILYRKSLANYIESGTSGNYQRFLLNLIGDGEEHDLP